MKEPVGGSKAGGKHREPSKCFLCDRPHMSRDCLMVASLKARVNAQVIRDTGRTRASVSGERPCLVEEQRALGGAQHHEDASASRGRP
jgi:hypothetical protein